MPVRELNRAHDLGAQILHEQIKLVRDEADRGRQQLADTVTDEKLQRELVVEACQVLTYTFTCMDLCMCYLRCVVC
jgi:hypothetical protein